MRSKDMFIPDKNNFLKACEKGNLIPVYRDILGDMDTPVSAFYKIAEHVPYSFLLESVDGEEKVARFSFLARNPEFVIRSKNQHLELITLNKGKARSVTKTIPDSPLEHIREILKGYRFVNLPGLPRFCGGIVGYIGYDVVRFFERLPHKPQDDLQLPDTLLVMAKDLLIFDHRNHRIKAVSCVHVPDKATRAERLRLYDQAVRTIDQLIRDIHAPQKATKAASRTAKKPLPVRSNCTEDQFKDIVKLTKKEIHAGEIIQAVLSQRFQVDFKTEPFHIYRKLRALNPSPYMYYLHFDDIKIIGSSPELLVRCEDGLVETRPIAGTRPRGKNDEQDTAFMKDLLADPKEKAEHIMLVDLGRNDLGRVCQKGTVRLSEFMAIEKYSHVMHIVSNVQGRLQRGKDAFDVLRAAFPAGTVSGAPKIRAMEIIDELENVSRGPYAGCIGYFSFSGNLDSCITIRTIVVKGQTAYVQAGAGIVADSQPAKEFKETVNKARAQLEAIQRAHEHFG